MPVDEQKLTPNLGQVPSETSKYHFQINFSEKRVCKSSPFLRTLQSSPSRHFPFNNQFHAIDGSLREIFWLQ